jgi:hypothetical protein
MPSREGLTADVLARILRRTALNPWLAVPLSALLAFQPPNTVIPILQQAARACALAALALSLNDALNHWSANNWTATAPSDWDWDKEIVLVTGAAGGIGASVVQHLLKRNINTRVVAVDYAPLAWTPPPKARVSYYQCDLSDSAAIRRLCDTVRREVGEVTVLVNNAGLCRGRTVMEGGYGDVEVTVRTNLVAPMLLAKEVLPGMVRRDHGHVVSVSSMSAVVPPAGVADYAATKAGVCAVHEVWRDAPCLHGGS